MKIVTIGRERRDGKFPVTYAYRGEPNMFGGFTHGKTFNKLHDMETIQGHTFYKGDTLVNNSQYTDDCFLGSGE